MAIGFFMSAIFTIPTISISSLPLKTLKTRTSHKKSSNHAPHMITCHPHYTAYNKLGAYEEQYNTQAKVNIRV